MLIKITIKNKLNSPEATEILRSLLLCNGFSLADIVENIHKGKSSLAVYVSDRTMLKKISKQFQSLKMSRVSMDVQEIKNDKWKTAWKRNIKPFNFTDHFKVIPIWYKGNVRLGRREAIYIDTDLAFGTGLHETTRFLAEMIVKKEGKFESILDIGTGTGILAIVASKCGAKEIHALDIEACAVEKAEKNMKYNGGSFNLLKNQDFQQYRWAKRFDFITANLNTYDLIKIRDKMCKLLRPGGFLAVSGIDLNNLQKVKRSFSAVPLRCLRIQKGRRWAALLYKKIQKEGVK